MEGIPPVNRWVIFYADESTFTSDDGTWAEAPGFGLFAVVYYRVDGTRHTQMEQHNNSQFVRFECEEAAGQAVKFGLWVDNDQYYKLFDLVHGEVIPQ